MQVSSRGRFRSIVFPVILGAAALAVACAVPAGANAAVTFSPRRVPQGGTVTVGGGPVSQDRTVLLGTKKTLAGSSFIGLIPSRKAHARIVVPVNTTPGKYFVVLCVLTDCHSSEGRLTVTAKTVPKLKGHYRVRYIHTDSRNQVTQEDELMFKGTTTWRENFKLESTLRLKGSRGAGPIKYRKHSYLFKQVGDFGSQAGAAGTDGSCPGSMTSTITSARNGTARVLGLTVKRRKISLDFTPGPVFQSTGRPSETVRSVSIADRICPPRYVSTNENRIFLGNFGNIYRARRELQLKETTKPVYFAHLNRGWKVHPKRHNGFARLVVHHKLSGLAWTDIFIIDRLR